MAEAGVCVCSARAATWRNAVCDNRVSRGRQRSDSDQTKYLRLIHDAMANKTDEEDVSGDEHAEHA